MSESEDRECPFFHETPCECGGYFAENGCQFKCEKCNKITKLNFFKAANYSFTILSSIKTTYFCTDCKLPVIALPMTQSCGDCGKTKELTEEERKKALNILIANIF